LDVKSLIVPKGLTNILKIAAHSLSGRVLQAIGGVSTPSRS